MPDSRVHLAPFVGGLNTEQSSVTDLLTYTSDELNCTVYPEELRGRRYGMDVEIDGQWFYYDARVDIHKTLLKWNRCKNSL